MTTRIIKFRAWDNKEKKWLLGYEMSALGGFSMFGEMMMMGEYASLLSKYFPDSLEDIVLMQFTGLLDKNGKEIWEGDIVVVDHRDKPFSDKMKFRTFNCEVYFSNGSFKYRWPRDYGKYRIGHELGSACEVIGNIYENPELLK